MKALNDTVCRLHEADNRLVSGPGDRKYPLERYWKTTLGVVERGSEHFCCFTLFTPQIDAGNVVRVLKEYWKNIFIIRTLKLILQNLSLSTKRTS